MPTDKEEQLHPEVPTPTEPLHSLLAVAKMFGVKSSTVRTWIKTGKIEGVKVLDRWHVPHREVVRIANENYGGPNAGTTQK